MKRRKILVIVGTLILMLSLALNPVSAIASPGGVEHGVAPGPDEQNWKECPPGMAFLDFEDKSDGDILGEEIPGVKFTTTEGQDWLVGDWAAGYNGKYPNGAYTSEGDKWAWLGVSQGSGIIEFTEGTAGYFSVFCSTYSGIVIDAYDEGDNLIDSSGWATNNINTGTMDKLWVDSVNKDIKYVIIHDTGNYWLIDAICTDAPGVGVKTVYIDIKPGSDPNSINPKSKGVIPVAILTTEDFDAATVDPNTVAFGPDEAAPVHHAIEDVDNDGDLDLILHFKTEDIGIKAGDTEATLTGQTYDGIAFFGTDSVRTVPEA